MSKTAVVHCKHIHKVWTTWKSWEIKSADVGAKWKTKCSNVMLLLIPSTESCLPPVACVSDKSNWDLCRGWKQEPGGWPESDILLHFSKYMQWKIIKGLHQLCYLSQNWLYQICKQVSSGSTDYKTIDPILQACVLCSTDKFQVFKSPKSLDSII